jgi:hypothetical protein
MKNSYLWLRLEKTKLISLNYNKLKVLLKKIAICDMKKYKRFITFISIFTALALACNNDEGNKGENGNPDSVSIAQYENIDFEKQEYSVPTELVYNKTGKDFLYDKIYPIGWSKNGMFAYIIEPADEGSGLYWFELVILDIVNNKVAWSWKPSEISEGSVSKIWKENYGLFKKNLSESEIIQQKNFSFKSGKTSYKGNDYELILDAKSETDPDFGFEVVKEVEINIVSPELGKKQIYKKKNEEYSLILAAYIPGYLLSPFDDRVVVFCQQERNGYEGPPNVVFFDLIGTDLIRGFKKEKDS